MNQKQVSKHKRKPNPYKRMVEIAYHGFYNIYKDDCNNMYAYIDKKWTLVTYCQPHGCYYVLGEL